MLNRIEDQDGQDYGDVLFVGVVVDNNDPDQVGRIKATVPGLFESDSASNLPWILPSIPMGVGALETANTQGVLPGIPDVGTGVMIELQQGDPHHPTWVGGRIRKGSLPSLLATNYPKRRGFVDSAGNKFYIDTTPGSVEFSFEHKSGTKIFIADNGAMTITLTNGLTVTGTGNVDVSGISGNFISP